MLRRLDRLRSPELHRFAVYGVSVGLAAVFTLIQTRLLWSALGPKEFGIWALIDPMLLPAASLVLLGIDHSIVKQLRVDRLPLNVVAGSLLASTVPATLIGLLGVGLAARLVFNLDWTTALLLTLAGEALILMLQTAFRSDASVYWFAALLLGRNVLYLAVLVFARQASALPLSLGVVFLARGACVFAVSLGGLAVLRPVLRIDWPRYADALRYGFPLLLTTFIYALSDMTDRWFLAEFTGVVAVGLYALHLKVAAILSQAIVIPFGMWFQPERFKRMDAPDGGRGFFIRVATALALVCGFLSGAVWLGRDLLLGLLAPGVPASPLVLGCCLGSVTCLALSQALNVGLLLPGQTGKNAICTGFAVLATVIAAAALVPILGAAGAAVSRLLGGLVLLVATAAASARVFPVAFRYPDLLLYFTASAGAAIGIDALLARPGLVALIEAECAWAAVTLVLGALLWNRLRTGELVNRPASALRVETSNRY